MKAYHERDPPGGLILVRELDERSGVLGHSARVPRKREFALDRMTG
jgi:hypothetical protein